MFSNRAMVVIVSSAIIVVITMGIRQAFGLFLPAITNDLGVGREVFGLASAIQNIVLPQVAENLS